MIDNGADNVGDDLVTGTGITRVVPFGWWFCYCCSYHFHCKIRIKPRTKIKHALQQGSTCTVKYSIQNRKSFYLKKRQIAKQLQ